jgi:hypothetical protein
MAVGYPASYRTDEGMNKGRHSPGCRSRLHLDVDDCGADCITRRTLTCLWIAAIAPTVSSSKVRY